LQPCSVKTCLNRNETQKSATSYDVADLAS
jgi:hypothetical protein